jgi:hypothetical protein
MYRVTLGRVRHGLRPDPYSGSGWVGGSRVTVAGWAFLGSSSGEPRTGQGGSRWAGSKSKRVSACWSC